MQDEVPATIADAARAPPEAGSSKAVGRASARATARNSDRAWLRRKTRPKFEHGPRGKLRVVDLFAGCGGITLGIAQAAHTHGRALEVALALDFHKAAINVYRDNFPKANAHVGDVVEWFPGDIDSRPTSRETDLIQRLGQIDILAGGPPCQGNSDLNNHTRRGDPRNALYLRMVRAAQLLSPRLVLIENVPSVVHDRGGVVQRAEAALRAAHYDVHHETVNLLQLGVPQRRKRHFLIATRGRPTAMTVLQQAKARATARRTRTVDWAISDLLGRADTPGSTFHATGNPTDVSSKRIDWLFDHDAYVLDDEQRPPCHRDKPHSYRSVYGRMRWDQPAPTITTGYGSMGQGCYVHPKERRTITPHEAARLQTFPDFFSFDAAPGRTAWARLIGNAVPPLGAYSLVRETIPDETTDS